MRFAPSEKSSGTCPGFRGRPAEAGFSLLEGLFAAALLLVVAVSVLPLFMRALESNTRGGRASQVSTFATAELEEINQATIDRADWRLLGNLENVRELDTLKWITGSLYKDGSNRDKIGDGRWVPETAATEGLSLWIRDMAIRKYTFADIHTAVEVDGVTLSTLGDARIFDSPLSTDDTGDLFNAHITEFRITLREDREALPLSAGQRMILGHFRTF